MSFFDRISSWLGINKDREIIDHDSDMASDSLLTEDDCSTSVYKFRVKDRESSHIEIVNKEKIDVEDIIKDSTIVKNNILNDDILKGVDKAIAEYAKNIDESTKTIMDVENDDTEESQSQDVFPKVVDVFIYHYLNMLKDPLANEDCISIYKFFSEDSEIEDHIDTDIINKDSNIKENNKYLKDSYLYNKENDKKSDDFSKWIISILTAIKDKEINIENIAHDYIKKENIYVCVSIENYTDEEKFLISDKIYDVCVKDKSAISFKFNVEPKVYLQFTFIKEKLLITEEKIKAAVEEFDIKYELAKKGVEFFTGVFLESFSEGNILVDNACYDSSAIKDYNQHIIQNCHEHVFGASKEYSGVTVSS